MGGIDQGKTEVEALDELEVGMPEFIHVHLGTS